MRIVPVRVHGVARGFALSDRAFHLLAKPTGAACNLDCKYCFFLSKERLYPNSDFRMSDEVLEAYLRQYLSSQPGPEINVAWQGGEPTLMGIEFFRRSIEIERRYTRPGTSILNTIQTNGVLLDDEWCAFFKDNRFLVGLSLDGPREMHDAYRVDKSGAPSFDKVMRGLSLLQKHGVEFNLLTTVHAKNADRPLAVYRFLRDEAGARFIQFIPIVEQNSSGHKGNLVTDRSVSAEQFGRFLIAIFDDWLRRDVGHVFVQMFDVALAAWAGEPPSLCVFSPTCGGALALEHNGDLYSCDHFVEPKHRLGNIRRLPMADMAASEAQRGFGQSKLDSLPRYCQKCSVRFACHGGCPKDRFIRTPGGEPNLNYLCAGYKAFFLHVDGPMRQMTALLRAGRAPAEVMFSLASRNDRCPCRSGKKLKQCHGRATI
jgi:uncharacterized protein